MIKEIAILLLFATLNSHPKTDLPTIVNWKTRIQTHSQRPYHLGATHLQAATHAAALFIEPICSDGGTCVYDLANPNANKNLFVMYNSSVLSAAPTAQVKEVIILQTYDDTTLADDVAILELVSTVKDAATAVSLRRRRCQEEVQTVGWGYKFRDERVAFILQRVQTFVITNDCCSTPDAAYWLMRTRRLPRRLWADGTPVVRT